jgi:hypothetical protein
VEPGSSKSSDHPHEFEERYGEHLKKKLPPLIQKEIEEEVEKEFDVVEEKMRGKIIGMIQNLARKIFEDFRASQPVPATAIMEHPDPPQLQVSMPELPSFSMDLVAAPLTNLNGIGFSFDTGFGNYLNCGPDPVYGSAWDSSGSSSNGSDRYYLSNSPNTSVGDGQTDEFGEASFLDLEAILKTNGHSDTAAPIP